jgi:hypothetical protein
MERASAPLIPADAARAADADREAVAERLRIAAGDGRIDLAELEDRRGSHAPNPEPGGSAGRPGSAGKRVAAASPVSSTVCRGR